MLTRTVTGIFKRPRAEALILELGCLIWDLDQCSVFCVLRSNDSVAVRRKHGVVFVYLFIPQSRSEYQDRVDIMLKPPLVLINVANSIEWFPSHPVRPSFIWLAVRGQESVSVCRRLGCDAKKEMHLSHGALLHGTSFLVVPNLTLKRP